MLGLPVHYPEGIASIGKRRQILSTVKSYLEMFWNFEFDEVWTERWVEYEYNVIGCLHLKQENYSQLKEHQELKMEWSFHILPLQ